MNVDRARELNDARQIDALFGDDGSAYKCEECKSEFLRDDMEFTWDHKEVGCCKECAKNPMVAYEWGF